MSSVGMRRVISRAGYRYQKHHGGGIFLVIVLGLLAFGVFRWYSDIFSPLLRELCEAKANRIGQETVHRSVSELLSREEYLGCNFLRVEKTAEGEPALVLPDTAVMNRFRSELTLLVTEKIASTNNAEITIPLGNLSGLEILSNRGPNLRVDAYPYGEVFVELLNEFSDAGINQTRHAMTVKVTLQVSLMLPGHRSYGTKVVTTVPMSETVVVGSVPNSYTNLETDKNSLKDDLLNVIDD